MENRKINLYLDDIREAPEGFVVARTIEEALEQFEKSEIGVLSLDHDLGVDNEGNLLKTGYDLVKIICRKGLYADEIRFHTSNPVGRDNMYQTLTAARDRGFISGDIKIRR